MAGGEPFANLRVEQLPNNQRLLRSRVDPRTPVGHLQVEPLVGWLSDQESFRHRLLFACGCCRMLWPLLNERAREAVQLVERFADGQASEQEVRSVRHAGGHATDPPRAWAAEAVGALTARDHDWELTVADRAARALRDAAGEPFWAEARQRQMHLLQDVCGSLVCPVTMKPVWLGWNDGTVVKIAQVIHDAHRFADLPILADALEEAGCTDSAILEHCRNHPEHARGCWVIDGILASRQGA
jgi:hypothetical protein